jgi:hypothetical protein
MQLEAHRAVWKSAGGALAGWDHAKDETKTNPNPAIKDFMAMNSLWQLTSDQAYPDLTASQIGNLVLSGLISNGGTRGL